MTTTRVTLRRTLIACGALALALVAAIVALSLIGSERLPASASLCAIFTVGASPCGLSRDQYDILFQLRLPRILLAAAVGGSLATAGASYQALLRNPLAEPYLLGVSNGAAVGTMIALVPWIGIAAFSHSSKSNVGKRSGPVLLLGREMGAGRKELHREQ